MRARKNAPTQYELACDCGLWEGASARKPLEQTAAEHARECNRFMYLVRRYTTIIFPSGYL